MPRLISKTIVMANLLDETVIEGIVVPSPRLCKYAVAD